VLDPQLFFDLIPYLTVNSLYQLLKKYLFAKEHTLQKIHNPVSIFDIETGA